MILKIDSRGRVRTPPEDRAVLLAEPRPPVSFARNFAFIRAFQRSMKLTAALLLLAVTASAQQAPRPGFDAESIFARDDKNKDGKLSIDELPEGPRRNFQRMDRDGDGGITLDELRAAGRAMRQDGRGTPARPASASESLEAIKDIPYAGTDNPRQRLDLFLPAKRSSDKPLPVIVFIHGGGWKAGDKASGAGQLSRFVQSGDYAGVSAGYRLTNEAGWPAQIHDCKAAIRWIRGHAGQHGLDADKIGVWGSSAGGHLASMLGTSGDVKELEGALGSCTESSSRVSCVVNYFGPENFITMVDKPSTIDRTTPDYPEAVLIGGRVQDKPDAARAASPITYVTKDDPPFLTAHGTKDPLVPYEQAVELDAAMKKAGASHLLIEMTGGGHGFRSSDLDARVKQFFDLHLRGVPGEISTAPIPSEAAKK